jgi:hypothetical protein
MLGHLKLRIAVLEMAEQIEQQARAAQLGVTVKAENQYLPLNGR